MRSVIERTMRNSRFCLPVDVGYGRPIGSNVLGGILRGFSDKR